jgi:hypothetical protein
MSRRQDLQFSLYVHFNCVLYRNEYFFKNIFISSLGYSLQDHGSQ